MILVTGGTGFIGSRIVRGLLARGLAVVCFDLRPLPGRLREEASHPMLRLEEGDIARLDDLTAVLQRHRVSRVIHTAAMLRVAMETAPADGIRTNVIGTTNVFEAARAFGIARVVFASSLTVYGDPRRHGAAVITEDTPPAPESLYAHTKVANERLAAQYTGVWGIDIRGLRVSSPFGHLGEEDPHGGEVSRLIALPVRGRPARIRLGPEERVPSTYVDDVAEIFIRLAIAPELRYPMYLCPAYAPRMDEIAGLVRHLVPNADIAFTPPGDRSPLVHRIDAGRLEHDLDYRLPPLEDRVRQYVRALSARGV